jgi:hypothetical protein
MFRVGVYEKILAPLQGAVAAIWQPGVALAPLA